MKKDNSIQTRNSCSNFSNPHSPNFSTKISKDCRIGYRPIFVIQRWIILPLINNVSAHPREFMCRKRRIYIKYILSVLHNRFICQCLLRRTPISGMYASKGINFFWTRTPRIMCCRLIQKQVEWTLFSNISPIVARK